jgi:hypothetical protein
MVARLLEPLADRALGNALAELRHLYLGHRALALLTLEFDFVPASFADRS